MKIISRPRGRCYCAYCKTQRSIYTKKHVDLTNVVLALAFAWVTVLTLFSEPDARVMGIFCVYAFMAEMFIYFRWRMNIVCSLCGFDPVLYKKSPERAAERVKEFFEEQVENPRFWLTQSPLLEVQKRIRQHEKKALEKEHLLRRTKSTSLAPNKSV